MDVLELDRRLYEFQDGHMVAKSEDDSLCVEASTLVDVLRAELDAHFFNSTDRTRNWLHIEGVLCATLVTPGGGAMLKKVSSRFGQPEPTPRARAAVLSSCRQLLGPLEARSSRQGELERERQRCRPLLIG